MIQCSIVRQGKDASGGDEAFGDEPVPFTGPDHTPPARRRVQGGPQHGGPRPEIRADAAAGGGLDSERDAGGSGDETTTIRAHSASQCDSERVTARREG